MYHKPRPLPNVTVVMVGNVELELARMALERTLQQIRPAAVHIWSDKSYDIEDISVPYECFNAGLSTFEDVAQVLWFSAPQKVDTSHMLIVQWDSWVLNAECWTEEFLSYDYIGAPWPWHPNKRIGNGGFSLRSTQLMTALDDFEIIGPEDDCLCRHYRPQLESYGFRWAPEDLAARFSFEHGPQVKTFGFHGAFNFPRVLPNDDFIDLVARAGKYAVGSMGWQRMLGVTHA